MTTETKILVGLIEGEQVPVSIEALPFARDALTKAEGKS